MKKMFSLALALIMALALCVPAFADEPAPAATADIAVENPAENETYKAYKIFDYTSDGANFAYYIDTDDMVIPGLNTLIEAYAQDGTDVFTLTPSKSDPTHLNVVVNDGVTVAPVKLVEYLDDHLVGQDPTKTADATGKFEDLALGYYFVDTTMGALCSLVNAGTEQKLYEKNSTITVDKEVQEDSNDAWGSESTADIGDVVPFHTIITIPKNENAEAEFAGVQNLVMHDQMDETLDFQDDVVVYFDATVEEIDADEAAAKVVAADNYEVVADPEDECTFEVVFDQDWLDTMTNADHTIIVCYTAILTEEAETDDANENDSKITWGEKSTTSWDTTKTYTFEFDLLKYTMNGDQQEELEGAEFTLSMTEDGANPLEFVEISDGVYRLANDEDADDTKTTTLEAGTFKIEGLDADTYYLTETKAPDGYNMLTEAVEIEITEKEENSVIVGHILTQNGEEVDKITVENKAGIELPSTGGMGTTIFYVVGGVLMAGAAILLVTKKKLANQE